MSEIKRERQSLYVRERPYDPYFPTALEAGEKTLAGPRSSVEERQTPYVRERPYNPYFPTTLEGFGYKFDGGKLVHVETGGPFVYEVLPGRKDYNQRHYKALGETITDTVYNLLENEVGLLRIPVPKDCGPMVGSFIFVSEGALTNQEKLMVLVNGNGAVRAGQWSRRLIINDSLASGTQLPYIQRALQEGYGVVVLNTNRNSVVVNETIRKIPESSTPEIHGNTVWRDYILASPARRIDIVAHGSGGKVTLEMMKTHFQDFRRRVHRIAFADSGHSLTGVDPASHRWITGHALNWVTHGTPLNIRLYTDNDVQKISAGTTEHVETPCCAIDSIFAYFK